MRLEERDQRREQYRVARAAPQLIRPDSGQREEPLPPPFVAKRCCERSEGKSDRVPWGIIVVWTRQSLRQPAAH